jgi:hypothetical protein
VTVEGLSQACSTARAHLPSRSLGSLLAAASLYGIAMGAFEIAITAFCTRHHDKRAAEEARQAEREARRMARRAAEAYNDRVGAAIVKTLSTVKIDGRVVKVLTAVDVDGRSSACSSALPGVERDGRGGR